MLVAADRKSRERQQAKRGCACARAVPANRVLEVNAGGLPGAAARCWLVRQNTARSAFAGVRFLTGTSAYCDMTVGQLGGGWHAVSAPATPTKVARATVQEAARDII